MIDKQREELLKDRRAYRSSLIYSISARQVLLDRVEQQIAALNGRPVAEQAGFDLTQEGINGRD